MGELANNEPVNSELVNNEPVSNEPVNNGTDYTSNEYLTAGSYGLHLQADMPLHALDQLCTVLTALACLQVPSTNRPVSRVDTWGSKGACEGLTAVGLGGVAWGSSTMLDWDPEGGSETCMTPAVSIV